MAPRSDPRHANLVKLNVGGLAQGVEHGLGQILHLQPAGLALPGAGRGRHLDQTGAEGMNPDALMLHLFPQRLGEPQHGKLGGAIDAGPGIAVLGGLGGDVDDGAVTMGQHVRQAGLVSRKVPLAQVSMTLSHSDSGKSCTR